MVASAGRSPAISGSVHIVSDFDRLVVIEFICADYLDMASVVTAGLLVRRAQKLLFFQMEINNLPSKLNQSYKKVPINHLTRGRVLATREPVLPGYCPDATRIRSFNISLLELYMQCGNSDRDTSSGNR